MERKCSGQFPDETILEIDPLGIENGEYYTHNN